MLSLPLEPKELAWRFDLSRKVVISRICLFLPTTENKTCDLENVCLRKHLAVPLFLADGQPPSSGDLR